MNYGFLVKNNSKTNWKKWKEQKTDVHLCLLVPQDYCFRWVLESRGNGCKSVFYCVFSCLLCKRASPDDFVRAVMTSCKTGTVKITFLEEFQVQFHPRTSILLYVEKLLKTFGLMMPVLSVPALTLIKFSLWRHVSCFSCFRPTFVWNVAQTVWSISHLFCSCSFLTQPSSDLLHFSFSSGVSFKETLLFYSSVEHIFHVK